MGSPWVEAKLAVLVALVLAWAVDERRVLLAAMNGWRESIGAGGFGRGARDRRLTAATAWGSDVDGIAVAVDAGPMAHDLGGPIFAGWFFWRFDGAVCTFDGERAEVGGRLGGFGVFLDPERTDECLRG
jgi:hypothetical protein